MKSLWCAIAAAILAVVLVPEVEAGGPPFEFSTSDGDVTLKLGFLLQPQYEALENGTDTKHNVFFRRLRLMAGGKLTPKLSYFIESDSPNLGKEDAAGNREADIFLQDAYLSYAFRPDSSSTAA